MRSGLVWFLGGVAVLEHLVGIHLDNPNLCAFVKPVPLVLLTLWVAETAASRFRTIMLAGLILSLVGDVLLSAEETFFLEGLIFFLGAHLCYITAIYRTPHPKALRLLWPFLVWGGGLFAFLRPGLGEMLVPVFVYMLVICTMMWRASCCYSAGPWGRIFFLGALLFGVSDSLLALNLFYQPFPIVESAVMLTYWAGQTLLAYAVVRHEAPQ